MAGRPGTSQDAILERRERIVELSRRGRMGWQIAFDLGLSTRTVQRHLRKARGGEPDTRCGVDYAARRAKGAALFADGYSRPEIAKILGISLRAAYRDRTEYNRKLRQQ